MSRPAERARASGDPYESHDELEELEDEAILAHETAAHLPQKRAQVTEEARSIVISEPMAAGQRPFRSGRGESTVVVDRRELEATRNKILQRRRRGGKGRRVLWAALAAAAVVVGGALLFLSTRTPGPQPVLELSQAVPALDPAREARPPTAGGAPGVAARSEAQREPPKVSLEELPLERPRRKPPAP